MVAARARITRSLSSQTSQGPLLKGLNPHDHHRRQRDRGPRTPFRNTQSHSCNRVPITLESSQELQLIDSSALSA